MNDESIYTKDFFEIRGMIYNEVIYKLLSQASPVKLVVDPEVFTSMPPYLENSLCYFTEGLKNKVIITLLESIPSGSGTYHYRVKLSNIKTPNINIGDPVWIPDWHIVHYIYRAKEIVF